MAWNDEARSATKYYREAIDAGLGPDVIFNEALSRMPDSIELLMARASAKREKEDNAGSIADCDAVLRLHPGHAGAYDARGLARQHGGDIGGAIADYTKAIELDGASPSPWSNRGFARQFQGDTKGAIADLERAIEIAGPNHPSRPLIQRMLDLLKKE